MSFYNQDEDETQIKNSVLYNREEKEYLREILIELKIMNHRIDMILSHLPE